MDFKLKKDNDLVISKFYHNPYNPSTKIFEQRLKSIDFICIKDIRDAIISVEIKILSANLLVNLYYINKICI